MAYLLIQTSTAPPTKTPLNGPTTIGRGRSCNIWIADLRLSREHCRIEPRGTGWQLVDLSSSNGTRLDGKRITELQLTDGVTFEVGDTKLTFRAGDLTQRRPADPFSAAARRLEAPIEPPLDPSGSTLTGTRFASRVPNPEAKTDIAAAVPPAKPLAFSRPPARPIVQGVQPGSGTDASAETGWFKAIVARLRGN